jgi:peptide deformylase
MILDIRKYPAKCLLTPCEEVVSFDAELKKLVDDMTETMFDTKGIGIAANQVGVCNKLFVARLTTTDTDKETVEIFINPTIEEKTGPDIVSYESCLSLPGIRAALKARKPDIIVSAFGLDGLPFKARYVGKNAVIIQHECEHLDGKTMLDSMGSVQRMMAKNKLKKWNKDNDEKGRSSQKGPR